MKLNITQAEETLMQAARELADFITEHNKILKSKIGATDLNEPEYHDYQTCHELQVIARKLSEL
tara:strand:+ start:271 stop:462 length:192 start_codon:yes stop_codon:yes gene_type:complete